MDNTFQIYTNIAPTQMYLLKSLPRHPTPHEQYKPQPEPMPMPMPMRKPAVSPSSSVYRPPDPSPSMLNNFGKTPPDCRPIRDPQHARAHGSCSLVRGRRHMDPFLYRHGLRHFACLPNSPHIEVPRPNVCPNCWMANGHGNVAITMDHTVIWTSYCEQFDREIA